MTRARAAARARAQRAVCAIEPARACRLRNRLGCLVATLAVVAGCGSAAPVPALDMSGVAETPCTGQPAAIPPHPAPGIAFITGSSVLTSNRANSCTGTAVAASERWLASGTVPGGTAAEHALATRALLDLRLSVRPDGAVVAAYYPKWDYTWPRDSSWVAAALADTGHAQQAYEVLRFLQRSQPAGGIWAARYHPDGSGPVTDGRPAQLDSDGWVPWAVWTWVETQHLLPSGTPSPELLQLWPMVSRAADAAAASLTSDGLPGPAMDYWEEKDRIAVTLGTAAPLLAGLRAAAAIASIVPGTQPDRARWAAAATRLSTAVTRTFGSTGYQRTPDAGSGADAAITFLGPPFAAASPAVIRAERSAEKQLTLPNGGLRPGIAWNGAAGVAWTPETTMFALFDASTGSQATTQRLLSWVTAHRTALDEVPEQVSPSGQPVSVAPLAWTDAIVLLTLLAQSGPLPVPVP